MTFELAKILQSKRAFRQRLATRPIEEKLALLDALRARAVSPGLRHPPTLFSFEEKRGNYFVDVYPG